MGRDNGAVHMWLITMNHYAPSRIHAMATEAAAHAA